MISRPSLGVMKVLNESLGVTPELSSERQDGNYGQSE